MYSQFELIHIKNETDSRDSMGMAQPNHEKSHDQIGKSRAFHVLLFLFVVFHFRFIRIP